MFCLDGMGVWLHRQLNLNQIYSHWVWQSQVGAKKTNINIQAISCNYKMRNDYWYDYWCCRSNPAVAVMNTEWSDNSDYGYNIHSNPAGEHDIYTIFNLFRYFV